MSNIKRYLYGFLCLCILWLPIEVEAIEDTDTQAFLTWYEEHKNDPQATYDLLGNIYLTGGTSNKPIVLDGEGVLDIDCGIYSIYVESDVIIDNTNLYILGSWKATSPTMIVRNSQDGTQAKLTLKSGGIYGSSTGLSIQSGQLISPQDEHRFTIVSGTDNKPALEIATPFIELQNLDITVSGEHHIVAVSTIQDIKLQNCRIEASIIEGGSSNSTVIAIQAGNKIQLENTSVKAIGNNAQSVVSNGGNTQIQVDQSSILTPSLMAPPSEDTAYRIDQIEHLNIVVPIYMSSLNLPNQINTQLSNWNDTTQRITRALQVEWDDEQVQTCLLAYGECEITGSFAQIQLAEESIYAQNFQPKITIKVVPSTAMNKLQVAQIKSDVENPLIEVQVLRPYGANYLSIEYSSDGINWEAGYCKNTIDNSESTNILRCDNSSSAYILTPIYFSSIHNNGQIRAVVSGGSFDGIKEAVRLDTESLLTRPGEDGGGGNRGGSGQWEGERNHGDEESESNDIVNPANSTHVNIIQPTGAIDTRTLPFSQLIISIGVCYLLCKFRKQATSLPLKK